MSNGFAIGPSGTSRDMEFRDNQTRCRFELVDGDDVVAFANYSVAGVSVVLPHTEVDPDRRNQGLGALLVQQALDRLRDSGRTIVPACEFVAEFIDTHPGYREL